MRKGKYNRKYTDEIVDFISKNVREHSDKTIASMIKARWDVSVSESSVTNAKARYGIKSGVRRGTFIKGQKSWNKGKKMETKGRMAETQFKKGQTPTNHRPVGSERINKDGYVEIKVGEPSTWAPKHRLIWEQHNGPIPKGNVIIFLDGDKSNLSIENLEMIKQSQLSLLNKFGLIKNDPELTKTGVNLASLILKTSSRLKG